MEQATIVSYAFGYVAAMIVAFLILLPVLIPILLLFLLAGAVLLLLMGLRALALGIYRFTAGLVRGLGQAIKRRRDGPHGSHGGHRFHMH